MEKESRPKIDVKTAIIKAREYFVFLFPDKTQVRLEEVDQDMKFWHITFGYANDTYLGFMPITQAREYKTISLNLTDGEFDSAKIRATKGT